MVQLNATYRVIEESVGKLLPQQTKDQLAHLEGLARLRLLRLTCSSRSGGVGSAGGLGMM